MTPSLRASLGRAALRGQRAFTLLEILVVLAIIGMLVGLLVSNIGGAYDDAKISSAQIFVKQSMALPLQQYRIHMGNYPTTAEGLEALVKAPANKAARWRGPYVQDGKIPLDPWGNPYQYRFPSTKNKNGYDLFSFGPDGTENEKSIGNW